MKKQGAAQEKMVLDAEDGGGPHKDVISPCFSPRFAYNEWKK